MSRTYRLAVPRAAALFICLFAGALSAEAQEYLPGSEVGGETAYYTFVRPGEVAIEVLVLGDVRAPGLYAVGLGTDFERLLALTGGIASGSSSAEVRRELVLRLYREGEGGRNLIYEQPLDTVLGEAAPPPLESGDALMVEVIERRRWLTVDNAFRLLSFAGTLFLVIERLAN